MPRRLFISLVILLFVVSCQKKPTSISPIPDQGEEGPLQTLAWNAVGFIKDNVEKQGLQFKLQILRIQNPAGLPDQAVGYFRSILEYQIRQSGGVVSNSGMAVTGSLINEQTDGKNFLRFEFQTTNRGVVVISGESRIHADSELEKTLAYFRPDPGAEIKQEEPHVHHREVDIPTPVAIITLPVLDVSQACTNNKQYCDLAVLYEDSFELIDWKTGERTTKTFPSDAFAQVRSRAPSGKIIGGAGLFTILNNNLNSPVFYDSQWAPISGSAHSFLPQPEAGLNSYALKNGKFYDFELIEARGLAVIETSHRLSIATAGTISTATELVGDCIALNLPSIYTSAPVFMDEKDSVMKFNYDGTSLILESARQSEGTILDLSVTDLNLDGTSELLVTVQRKDGSYIEVWDTF